MNNDCSKIFAWRHIPRRNLYADFILFQFGADGIRDDLVLVRLADKNIV
jgi:hypothetical protein